MLVVRGHAPTGGDSSGLSGHSFPTGSNSRRKRLLAISFPADSVGAFGVAVRSMQGGGIEASMQSQRDPLDVLVVLLTLGPGSAGIIPKRA